MIPLSQTASLFSFADNFMDLARTHPEEFILEVERRYELDSDWKIFICAIKEGCRADKSFTRKKYRPNDIKPGEWIVRPYSTYRINTVLKAIEKGRLKEKGVKQIGEKREVRHGRN